MPTIIIKTQAELDALPAKFEEFTVIEIHGGTPFNYIVVNKARGSSHVVARESSHVVAWESSHVVARGSSHVVARESSHVEAWESSHVEAWGSSHVVARESSHVEAWESSHVEAWGSSHVVARESSHVEAWESSHVEAWGSSHVVARESSHVVAWGSSHVVAWESSHVEAWESVAVHNHSPYSTIEAFGFAVVFLLAKAKSLKRTGDNTTVVEPKRGAGNKGWLEDEGVNEVDGTIILFKRVSSDWKTQEKRPQETLWAVGSTVTHLGWDPSSGECGRGKFHACSRPYFCDEFRSTLGDRYIAIAIKLTDMHAWTDNPEYPHKCAFREGVVLHECDRYGRKLELAAS